MLQRKQNDSANSTRRRFPRWAGLVALLVAVMLLAIGAAALRRQQVQAVHHERVQRVARTSLKKKVTCEKGAVSRASKQETIFDEKTHRLASTL
ncbi:hypothetical protein [Lacticaseibacillus camelliae]|uniref:hypothetical protein n=1 Tax=Lacticaseibacillus camelliae TaxID=381742 RepID=UPI000AB57D03|nr:hypothetical protein [Lacticaseibacillus camelliae]